ncbi:MAG: zinc-dependent alcohol dehydrogenase [Terrimicrobiaceae bacterium]
MKRIAITSYQTAELESAPPLSAPLQPREVRGRTVVSLTSPGTELHWNYLGKNFPSHPGYASVFTVDEVGAEVTDLAVGDPVFGPGGHQECQQMRRESVVPIPPGLEPERAIFARLAGVSMSTLNTTTAHPPSRVLVTGLGPVGNLAAQIFSACGYWVTAVDPVESRRETARLSGLADVRASIAEGTPDITGEIALHVECSGHEQAALDGCKCVRKRGEVVLVGVPWEKRTDISSFDLLHAVFHRYVVLRSGWEWEVALQPTDFRGNSISGNYAAAMAWIAAGKIKTDGLATCYSPERAQEVYSGLLAQTLPTPAAIFDWRLK